MFSSQNTKSVVFSVAYDPGADETWPLWRAPKACEITGVYVTVPNDVAASTANYFDITLYNGGNAGTATTALAAAVGGTAGWTGLTPKSGTVSEGTLAAGNVVTAKYDETGTATFTQITIQLDYVDGVGA
ncbi:MAG: hypothetical protein ACE5FD_01270 [Anaerolineae bacterium]